MNSAGRLNVVGRTSRAIGVSEGRRLGVPAHSPSSFIVSLQPSQAILRSISFPRAPSPSGNDRGGFVISPKARIFGWTPAPPPPPRPSRPGQRIPGSAKIERRGSPATFAGGLMKARSPNAGALVSGETKPRCLRRPRPRKAKTEQGRRLEERGWLISFDEWGPSRGATCNIDAGMRAVERSDWKSVSAFPRERRRRPFFVGLRHALVGLRFALFYCLCFVLLVRVRVLLSACAHECEALNRAPGI